MQHGDRVAATSFVVSAVLAGANGVGIRFTNRELAPLWGASMRLSLAAALLALVMTARGTALPRGRALAGAVLFGAFNFGGAYALTYVTLLDLHAGFAQIILAVVPLATLVLAAVEHQEKVRIAGVVGVALSLAGVVLLARAPTHEPVPVLPVLAAIGSALCFAQAAIFLRRFPQAEPVALNTIAMATGTLLLLAASVALGEERTLPEQPATWLALTYLVVIGSVVVFILYVIVLRYWAATRAAYGFVIIPFVTVALSAWLDEEPVHAGLVAGGLLVMLGVYVGALRANDGTPSTECG